MALSSVLAGSDPHQAVIVKAPVLGKTTGKGQQRPVDNSLAQEQQDNQQAADSSIAVREGMDGFKLAVRDADADKRRERKIRVVNEFFQIVHQAGHMIQ